MYLISSTDEDEGFWLEESADMETIWFIRVMNVIVFLYRSTLKENLYCVIQTSWSWSSGNQSTKTLLKWRYHETCFVKFYLNGVHLYAWRNMLNIHVSFHHHAPKVPGYHRHIPALLLREMCPLILHRQFGGDVFCSPQNSGKMNELSNFWHANKNTTPWPLQEISGVSSCMSLTVWCHPVSLTRGQCKFSSNRSASVQHWSPVLRSAGTCTFHRQRRGSQLQSEDPSYSKHM